MLWIDIFNVRIVVTVASVVFVAVVMSFFCDVAVVVLKFLQHVIFVFLFFICCC